MQQPIPPEILRQLKASKTRSELYEKVKIINSASSIPDGSSRSGATQIPNTRIGSNLPDDKGIQIQSILSEDFGTGLMGTVLIAVIRFILFYIILYIE